KVVRARRSGSVEDRWWARIDKGDGSGCWLWTGALYWTGYGQFPVSMGKTATAHRWGYERYIGPVPKRLELDHLCRVLACVRFDHLEPVTHLENVQRGRAAKWLGRDCIIEGCDRPAKVHGLCKLHNLRRWRASRQ
ncbi:MAG TPA: HNH endonuclease signature motif containing protein, partial [Streptosporangiaceae bacterium]